MKSAGPGSHSGSVAISALGRRFGLSRSTLLYYDRIGLLKATARSEAGYRRYSAADAARLERIGRFRKAGLPLRVIRSLLEARESGLEPLLVRRLEALNGEIRRLREQQRFILTALGRRERLEKLAFMSAEQFVAWLEAAGVSERLRSRLHATLEAESPEAHQRLLEFLCFPDEVIRDIRAWSRKGRGRAHGRKHHKGAGWR